MSGGARAREAGTVTIYRPRLMARSKLHLEADLSARIDSDMDVRARRRHAACRRRRRGRVR